MVADAGFVDLSGKTHRLSELNTHKGVVLVMTSATCPVSKRYVPSLAKLEKELLANDIALLLVNPIASEKLDDIKAQLSDLAIAAPYVHDKDKSLTALYRPARQQKSSYSTPRARSSTAALSTTSTAFTTTWMRRATVTWQTLFPRY